MVFINSLHLLSNLAFRSQSTSIRLWQQQNTRYCTNLLNYHCNNHLADSSRNLGYTASGVIYICIMCVATTNNVQRGGKESFHLSSQIAIAFAHGIITSRWITAGKSNEIIAPLISKLPQFHYFFIRGNLIMILAFLCMVPTWFTATLLLVCITIITILKTYFSR